MDQAGDQIGAQIRRGQMDKVPWMLILGEKEQENNTIALRPGEGEQEFGLTIEDLINRSEKLNKY